MWVGVEAPARYPPAPPSRGGATREWRLGISLSLPSPHTPSPPTATRRSGLRSCQPIIFSPLQACEMACFRNVLQLRITEAARFEVFATSDCQSGMRFIRLPFHAFGVASFGKTCHIATPKWHYVKCTLFQQAEVACSKSLPLWRVGMACF